ncbi:MAG: NAD-binding protein [Deltaproteobacteria bacterium]|nr:NAD-binding protein [Deltaproteobacteria bacterium]
MTREKMVSNPARSGRWRRFIRWLWGFWPHWPVAAAVIAGGLTNVLRSFNAELLPFSQLSPFLGLEKSIAILSNSTQAILGVGLVLVGFGLLRRLAAAWSFTVILLLITLGVNVVQQHWGKWIIYSALMLLVMIPLRHNFSRQTRIANYTISLTSIFSILAYGTFGSYLLGTGFHPAVHDLTTSFYFTIVTLSTVGYGDISPVTPETRLFVVSLLIVGLSVFATAIASVLGPAITTKLGHILNPKGGRMKLEKHIILAGEGSIAANTAIELSDRKLSFVRILNRSEDAPDPEKGDITGDPTDEAVQLNAGIKKAAMVIAAGDNDGENAFITLLAKDLNPEVRVLAVANAINAIGRLKLARADLVFAPTAVGSRLLADLAEGDRISDEFRDLLEGEGFAKSPKKE